MAIERIILDRIRGFQDRGLEDQVALYQRLYEHYRDDVGDGLVDDIRARVARARLSVQKVTKKIPTDTDFEALARSINSSIGSSIPDDTRLRTLESFRAINIKSIKFYGVSPSLIQWRKTIESLTLEERRATLSPIGKLLNESRSRPAPYSYTMTVGELRATPIDELVNRGHLDIVIATHFKQTFRKIES